MKIVKRDQIQHQRPSSEPNYGFAESHILYETEQLFVSSEKVAPGQSASRPHYHADRDEIVFVLSGSLTAKQGDKEVQLQAGDSVCFEKSSERLHLLRNESNESAEFLVLRKSAKTGDAVFDRKEEEL